MGAKITEAPSRQIDRGEIALLLIFLIAFPFLFKPWIHGLDTVAYYSWLRSVAIEGSLDVGDEFAHYGYGSERGRTVSGYTTNEWPVGSAVLWSPFFLAAHGLSLTLQQLGLPISPDGYAPIYIWATSLASALYGFIAVLLTYRVNRTLWTPTTSALATATVWLSTPLVFYMYSHPMMSHANDAFAYALYLFVWHKTRSRKTWHSAALRGATAGLCALVRQVNAILVVPAMMEFLGEGLRAWQGSRKPSAITPTLLQIVAFSTAWWLCYSPQVVTWRIVFGQWIMPNPYRETGRGFNWLHPHLLEILFSTNRGLFVWTPVTLPAVLGWIPLRRRDRRLAGLLAANFLLEFWLISSWHSWSGAVAFGQRFFTHMMPAFAVGLGTFLHNVQRRIPLRWLSLACGLLIAWNGVLIVRYVLEDIPRQGPVPLGELIEGQFTAIPRYLGRIVRILIRRE